MGLNIKELNLLLLYLFSWEEDSRKNPGEKILRSWKGYKFEVLNELTSDKLILQSRESKSVVFTDTGKAEAEKLKKNHFTS